jgi:phosphoglycerate dehydrogenase-like enzyme
MASVVVTFDASAEMRAALEEELDGVASVTYLTDVPAGERVAVLTGADGVFGWGVGGELQTANEFAAIRSAKLLQTLSAGVNHLPFQRIPPEVPIASNRGAWAPPMAEHVLAMALALAKHLPQRHADLERGRYDQTPNLEIRGSTVAILGFGGVGTATATLFEAFGARIHAVTRSGTPDRRAAAVSSLGELDAVLDAADILVIALPLTRETSGLIGARELALMKPGAILINVARADIVDEEALYAHLRRNQAFSAGLDVWWQEGGGAGPTARRRRFLELPNVIGSPHNSAVTNGSLVASVHSAAANLARAMRGEVVQNLVNRAEYTGDASSAGSPSA